MKAEELIQKKHGTPNFVAELLTLDVEEIAELMEEYASLKCKEHEGEKGISCKEKYKETSKLIDGYSQMNSMPRALGFKRAFDIQCKLGGYSHLINASDVENVVEWLFEQGYDVVKLTSKT
jgi:hypothetical protein